MFKIILSILVVFLTVGGVRLESKQKIRSQYQNIDFVFDLAKSEPTAKGLAGTGQAVNVDQLPSLSGEGVSLVLFNIDPCGINLPHIHPRATELFYVVAGRFKTTFVEENTGRTIVNVLTPGQATFFPQGLIHEEQNIGCEPATFISAFSDEDPGVLTISNRLFTIPQEALTSTFNVSSSVIDSLRANLPANPALGNPECLNRCAKLSSRKF